MTLSTADLVVIGLLVLLLLIYWRRGRHWSKVPPKPKRSPQPRTWSMGVHIGPFSFWW